MSQVTFIWPERGRTAVFYTAWAEGRSIKSYLHTTKLRQTSILGLWKRLNCVNSKREKVRMSYVPVAGDVIVARKVR